MNNNQTLIIHKFQTLFDILSEIKNTLNFNFLLVNDNNFDEIPDEKNFLVISGDKKFSSENQIEINSYPVNILKLIEIINIQFLKNKFNQQNNIIIGKYSINFNSRIISYERVSQPLTEKELKIIDFLNKSKKPVNVNELQFKVWGHKSNLETHTVETHIHRLRKKINKIFKDSNFIKSSKSGYYLNES
tara:strand:+ start:495 stop:1061 length:567 start_codon:yes stop_codon:yes gene_type:complete